MESPGQAESQGGQANPSSDGEPRVGSEILVAKFLNPRRQEKPLLFMLYPYRKPTQVDEERILRPTEEALLRNSAK